jgi:hypothetical protein
LSIIARGHVGYSLFGRHVGILAILGHFETHTVLPNKVNEFEVTEAFDRDYASSGQKRY